MLSISGTLSYQCVGAKVIRQKIENLGILLKMDEIYYIMNVSDCKDSCKIHRLRCSIHTSKYIYSGTPLVNMNTYIGSYEYVDSCKPFDTSEFILLDMTLILEITYIQH